MASNAETAAELKRLQLALEKLESDIEVYTRDLQRATIALIEAEAEQQTAQAAFDRAKVDCQEVGGLNPADAALAIYQERAKAEELREELDAEIVAREAAIKQGQADYRCELTEIVGGIPIDRPARPACDPGYCCGAAVDDDQGVVIETCQRRTAIAYTWYPVRAKNATKNPPGQQIPWTCIEGASSLTATALSLVAALVILW